MKKQNLKEDRKVLFKAIDIANYLNDLHNELYGINISPLKLQKTLFFLFGEWGAFISKSNISIDGDWKELNNYSKYLFDEQFEAWLYGPVVKEVYKVFSNGRIKFNQIFDSNAKRYVGSFIKDLATELFELSDFRLVELSHQMDCWKKNFIDEANIHNIEIDRDSIINEFLLQL